MTGTPTLGCQSKVTTWLFEKKKGCPKAKADITSMASKASGVFLKIGYQYRGIPRHHFHLYLKETEFRFNQEDEDLFPIIASYLVNLVPISS